MVGRPKIPLINKREALEVALRIVDQEGLDALSIRRLATEMNVNGASFYYHFKNKDEILDGVAGLAMDDVTAPVDDGADWQEWMLANAHRYRANLIAHPDLILVMLRRGGLRFGLAQIDASIRRLENQGLAPSSALAMIETVEAFAIGSALAERNAVIDDERRADVAERFPALHRALDTRAIEFADEFDLGCRAILAAFSAGLNGTRVRKGSRRRTLIARR